MGPMDLHPTQLSTVPQCLLLRPPLRHHQHQRQLQDLPTTAHHLASLMRPPTSLWTRAVLTLVPSAMPSAPLILTAPRTLLVALRSLDASFRTPTPATRLAVSS